MDKKSWIIKALYMLEDVWPDAEVLRKGVEEDLFEGFKLDILIEKLQEAIKDVKDEGEREKMQKGIDVIKRINSLEKAEREQEEGDLADLEKMMEGM